MTKAEFYWLRNRAIHLVQRAKYRGELAWLSREYVQCRDCRKRAVHYDHRDYGKPLDVDPVCQGCNVRRGPAKITIDPNVRFEYRKAMRRRFRLLRGDR